MLTLVWKRGDKFLYVYKGYGVAGETQVVLTVPVFNIVRNEIDPDHTRPLHDPSDVVTTEPEGDSQAHPFMPRYFPSGTWKITTILAHPKEEPYLYPFFIATEAWQKLPVWALDDKGGYDHVTDQLVVDVGYGLHNSSSSTTLGCIRIGDVSDPSYLLQVVNLLKPALVDGGEGAQIKVTD